MPDPQQEARRLISTVPTDLRQLLASEPFVGLQQLGFVIREVPEPEVTGDCSVAGSLNAGPPPTITVVQAASLGRRHFSALHELGHSLIVNDDQIHDLFFGLPDGGADFEEAICDAIAGLLLLPDEAVAEHISPDGPTASSVLNLIESSTTTSREACCVRAAQTIRGPGHVMLARDGVAVFTASHATTYRVGRGTPQGDDHITVKAAQRGRCRESAPVVFESGAASLAFHADAVRAAEGYVMAVFTEDRPAWHQGLYLPPTDRAEFAAETVCTHCDVDFVALAAPCQRCGDHRHLGDGGCGRCSCQPADEHRLCGECFIRRPPSEYAQNSAVCDRCLEG